MMDLSSQTRHDKGYHQWYAEAIRLYNLDEPTKYTDSSALQLFLNSANRSSSQGTNYKLAIDCFIKAGNIHQTYQRYKASNELYHKAILMNNMHIKNAGLSYEAYLYLGSSFYFSNIIDSAQYYFEQASAIAITNKVPPAKLEQDRLYNSLGAIYFESANYHQAKNYFERALQALKTNTDDDQEAFVSIKSNIANCLLRLKQYDSALYIYKSLTSYNIQPNIIRQNTAHTYFELGQYDSALSLYKKLPVQYGFNRVKVLNDIGRIYMNRGQWQQAESVFDSAIAVNKKISAVIKNKEEALAYLYRSWLAERQGLTDEAITWCNEALREIHVNFKLKKIEDIPADVSQSVSPIILFDILHTKASLLYKKYKTSGQQKLLKASLQAYKKAILTAKFIKKNFDNDEATIFFTENYKSIYSEAIQIAHEAVRLDDNHLDDYIFFIENYKGRVLYHNLQNIQLKSNARIPDSVKRREKDIKQMMAFYTSRINNSTVEKDAGQFQHRVIELQVELSRLQKQYEQDTAYNLYRYQTEENESTISFIQSAIDNETALISYFIQDSVVYVLAINKRNAELKKIRADSSFYRNIRIFQQEAFQYTEGRRYNGYETSVKLYKSLIYPIEKITGSCSKWAIIPDGILFYLPFEALTKDIKTRDYVVLSKTVSYHYSLALLLKKNTHHYGDNKSAGSVAFAPYCASDEKIVASKLSVLPYSNQEVSTLGRNIYKALDATKQKFIQTASQHPLIHLATHASLGTDSSANWIQFYPSDSTNINNKLFVHEIYNLDLHKAELVILSACETAAGSEISGEGLLSLSRAFIYAGSDGIISTLWKTEDRVTAYLMQRLHNHLQNNISPETALQLAKKDLLDDTNIGSQYKTPNYWANFIYVGKLHKEQPASSYIWWIIIPCLLAITAIFFKDENRKK